MKQNNKLNKALRDALHEHTEPLYEAQWDRLSVVLGEQKKKRRFLPWFFMLFFATVTCLFAGYWLSSSIESKDGTLKTQAAGRLEGNSRSPENNALTAQALPQPGIFPSNTTHTLESVNNIGGPSDAVSRKAARLPYEPIGAKVTAADGSRATNPVSDRSEEYPASVENTSPVSGLQDVSAFETGTFLQLQGIEKIKMPKYSDSLPLMISMREIKKLKPKKRPKAPGLHRDIARYTIGISSGISPVSFSIAKVRNEERLHKDSRSVFAQSNKYSKSYFGNLNFELLLSKRIPVFLSTGLQYRQIIQDVDLSYEMKEIAYRDSSGTILTYFKAVNPLVFEYKQRNHLDFISMPLRLSYMMPLGWRSEFMISGGLNLSALVRTQGSALSVNEAEIKPLKQSYKGKFNTGFSGGVQFNRNIYKGFWLGLEAQWQRNSLNYDVQYSVVRSRISITNYNVQLKYKF